MSGNSLPISLGERLFVGARRWAYQAALVMIGAGIIHIIAVLLVPFHAEKDAWSRLKNQAGSFQFKVLDTRSTGNEFVSGLDPLFVHAACRVETTGEPVEVAFCGPRQILVGGDLQSLNGVVFSVNDRTVEQSEARFLIVTATQNSRIREADPLAYEENIIVETDQKQLIVVLRVYAPSELDRTRVADMVAGATCLPLGAGSGS